MTPLMTTTIMLNSATPALSEPMRNVECTRISHGPITPSTMCSTNQGLTRPTRCKALTYLRSG